MRKGLLFALCGATLITSCKEQTTVEPDVIELTQEISFNSTIEEMTRVDGSNFESGDKISVFAMEGSEYIADNVAYSYDGSIFTSTSPISLSSTDESFPDLSYAAIYPYSSDAALEFDFDIATDQSSEASYEATDLLTAVASATSSSTPTLPFVHALSGIVITFSSSDVDLSSATISVNALTSVACDVLASNYVGEGSTSSIKTLATSDGYTAIIAPQTIAAGSELITISLGGENYVWTTTSSFTVESGSQLSCTISFENKEISLISGDIQEWSYAGEIDGTLSKKDDDVTTGGDDEWKVYTSADGSTTGVWSDDIMATLFTDTYSATKNVEIYYNESLPGVYRIENIYTADFSCQIWGCTEADEAGYAIDPSTQSEPIYTYIHAEDPSAVWIEYHNSGYCIDSSYYGYLYYGSYVPENAAASEYTGDTACYGTMVDGYITFPASSFLGTLSLYEGAWLMGSSVSICFPGGTTVEPETPEGSVLPAGSYTLSGYSYFDSAWYSEDLTISYVSGSSSSILIYGLFYGYSSVGISATYDADTQTISIPDDQDFGSFSFGDSYGSSNVYFYNANDYSDIVFTLNSDGVSFTTSQYWGYYLSAFEGWYDVYSTSTITPASSSAPAAISKVGAPYIVESQIAAPSETTFVKPISAINSIKVSDKSTFSKENISLKSMPIIAY